MFPYLAAVNAGVTAHGFVQVLRKLDLLNEQIRSVGERIDFQTMDKLKEFLNKSIKIDHARCWVVMSGIYPLRRATRRQK